ncbi:MAG: DUF5752 family protein [Candidatus Bathyarchaeota archaeon]|nr:DUF5752 family protein [Candidatus Bathyarchaeota archaeon]
MIKQNQEKKNQAKKLPDKRSSLSLIPKKSQPSLTSPTTKPRLEQPKLAQTILRKLDYDQGFHFYKSLGQYTGITATSLHEFESKLKIVDEQSILFHYPRGDFQKWIRKTLKDKKLAAQIDIANSNLSSTKKRENLLSKINSRLKELQMTN